MTLSKITLSIWIVIALVLVAGLGYFWSQDGRVVCNSEYSSIVLLKGGYRSWGINYSDGHELFFDGTTRNLWRWPRFYHSDMRILMKDIPELK